MQTVVLVHAFGSSGRAWTPQVAGLGDRYRVIAPDLPCHGGASGPFTLDRAVESVRAAIADAGGRAHLVGISGRATVALLASAAAKPTSATTATVRHERPREIGCQSSFTDWGSCTDAIPSIRFRGNRTR